MSRNEVISVVVQTVGGALLVAAIAASGWTVSRIIELEASQRATRALVDAYKLEGDRRFSGIEARLDEISRKLDRLLERGEAP